MSERKPMTRVLITIPEEWANIFRERAESLGESFSEYLREAGRGRLTKTQERRLPEIVENRGGKNR